MEERGKERVRNRDGGKRVRRTGRDREGWGKQSCHGLETG